MLKDFIAIFFPNLCNACNSPMIKGEKIICTRCLVELPRVSTLSDSSAIITSKLVGKVNIASAHSFLYFKKSSRLQALLHRLKYNNQPEIGIFLGELYANELTPVLEKIDCIVPVPLHPSRERTRGYNQSTMFSKGISNASGIDILDDVVLRIKKTESQTNKSRTERLENVKGIFKTTRPEELRGKKILITDDVITTGATIEAFINELSKYEISEIHVATIAVAI